MAYPSETFIGHPKPGSKY